MSDEEAVYECGLCLDAGIRMAPQGPWPCRCERGRWAVDSFLEGSWSTPTDEPKSRSDEERDRLYKAERERELKAIHAEFEHEHCDAPTRAEGRDAPPVEESTGGDTDPAWPALPYRHWPDDALRGALELCTMLLGDESGTPVQQPNRGSYTSVVDGFAKGVVRDAQRSMGEVLASRGASPAPSTTR